MEEEGKAGECQVQRSQIWQHEGHQHRRLEDFLGYLASACGDHGDFHQNQQNSPQILEFVASKLASLCFTYHITNVFYSRFMLTFPNKISQVSPHFQPRPTRPNENQPSLVPFIFFQHFLFSSMNVNTLL